MKENDTLVLLDVFKTHTHTHTTYTILNKQLLMFVLRCILIILLLRLSEVTHTHISTNINKYDTLDVEKLKKKKYKCFISRSIANNIFVKLMSLN